MKRNKSTVFDSDKILFKKENIYEKQEHLTNILHNPLWQSRRRFPNPNIVYNRYENACHELWRIYKYSLIIYCLEW